MKKLFAILAVMGVLSQPLRHRQNRLQQLTKQKQHRLL